MSRNHFLIIGGTKGIGKQLSKTLISDNKNMVTILGRTPDHSIEESNSKIYSTDITQIDIVFKYLKESTKLFGNFTTVVFMQRNRSLNDEFDNDINVAIKSTKKIIDFIISNNLFNVKADWKSIIMVSSVADYYIAEEQPVGYHVAKAGLVQLARYYALTLGSRGIRVNIVSPCVVAKIEAKEYYDNNPELVAKFERFVPLGRMGNPDDIINAILFFASSKANYITGQNIVVDGGLTLRTHESLIRGNI